MKIELPQVGESVTEGVIGKWLKTVGERVEKFDPLVEVVTDKVNMEMPSPVSGVLTSIIAQEGETVPMGGLIAEIEVEGEEPATTSAPEPTAPTPVAEPQPASVGRTGELLKNVAPVGPTGGILAVESPPPTDSGRKRYSPAVLRLADEHNVDLSPIEGTGMNGRITRKDVQQVIDQRAATPEPATAAPQASPSPVAPGANEERVQLTPIRRLIAENMVKSATLIPQAWTTVEVDVSELILRRQAVRTDFQLREGINITYLPFVIKAIAESLKENPLLNSSWGGDSIILKKRINIGVAIATPDGLMVPVIHDADTLSIAGLAKRVHDLTDRARQGKLRLEDVQGGTFTANNTGVLGSVESKPLVNYPQAAILTTEAIVKRPVVINNAIAIRSMMNICMSFDHRIMDGAEASSFINAVKTRLEAIGPDTGVY
jgi:2-oxoisovalerate dehydrogenase E2 component (dihydrolipoyl transacylase)